MPDPTLANGKMESRRARLARNITASVLVALIFAGAAARMQDLGYPHELGWDEHHFVENARNMLHGKSDWNDHPPLGKLLIAGGMLIAGDNSTGWRLAPLALGLVLIVVAYLLAASLFRSRWAGLLAAAFIAADGFPLAYSKVALLDGMLVTAMMTAALLIWRARSWAGFALAGLAVGLAMSIKFSGAVLLVPLALAGPLRLGFSVKSVGLAAVAISIAAVAYVAEFAIGLSLAGDPNGVFDVARETGELLRHHLGLTDWKHPLTSRWYTWFVPLNAIVMHYVREGNVVRALFPLGHPILWWGVNLALVWTVIDAVRRARGRASEVSPDSAAQHRALSYLWLLWLLPLLPWVVSERDSYFYHYLPSYAFGLVLLSGWVSMIRKREAVQLGIVLVIAAVFVFCVPIWSKIPFDADSLLHALYFPRRG